MTAASRAEEPSEDFELESLIYRLAISQAHQPSTAASSPAPRLLPRMVRHAAHWLLSRVE